MFDKQWNLLKRIFNMATTISTTLTEFVKNLSLSVFYYLKNNLSATIEGHTLTTEYDIPLTLTNLEGKLPLVVLTFNAIRQSTDYSLGYGENVRAEYIVHVFGGGDQNKRVNEKIRQLLTSEVYSLFDRKQNISFKEYPSQTEKGKVNSMVSITSYRPAFTNEVDEFRTLANVYIDAILI